MKTLWIILGIIVLVLVGYFVFTSDPQAPAPSETVDLDAAPTSPAGASGDVIVITYDGTSFSPSDVTVPVGSTVSWVNESSERMWVASDEHPTHTAYDGTALREHCADGAPGNTDTFDQCSAGATYTFTFTRTGTWEYHNHAAASARGTVMVIDTP